MEPELKLTFADPLASASKGLGLQAFATLVEWMDPLCGQNHPLMTLYHFLSSLLRIRGGLGVGLHTLVSSRIASVLQVDMYSGYNKSYIYYTRGHHTRFTLSSYLGF